MRTMFLILFFIVICEDPPDTIRIDTIQTAEILLKEQKSNGIKQELTKQIAEMDSIIAALKNDTVKVKKK